MIAYQNVFLNFPNFYNCSTLASSDFNNNLQYLCKIIMPWKTDRVTKGAATMGRIKKFEHTEWYSIIIIIERATLVPTPTTP